EGSNNYLTITTTNGSEAITLGNATTNPSFNLSGTGSLTNGTWTIASDGTTTGLNLSSGQISGTLINTDADSGTSALAQGDTLSLLGGDNITTSDDGAGNITIDLDSTLAGLTSVTSTTFTDGTATLTGGSLTGLTSLTTGTANVTTLD